eukprot:PhM_4_TR10021/c0_g1_i3/m.95081
MLFLRCTQGGGAGVPNRTDMEVQLSCVLSEEAWTGYLAAAREYVDKESSSSCDVVNCGGTVNRIPLFDRSLRSSYISLLSFSAWILSSVQKSFLKSKLRARISHKHAME